MTPLTEDEVYRGIMQLPGPCPRCKKEMWGFICEHCGYRASLGMKSPDKRRIKKLKDGETR
jgi:DNA-directed RNA polymerase subunit RPC12/RpoP